MLRKNAKTRGLFCQLNELHLNSTKCKVWRESARSVKFIEFVEDSGKWSRPYVATLSLHSLIELRKYILTGKVLLDYQYSGSDFKNLISNFNLNFMFSFPSIFRNSFYSIKDEVTEVLVKNTYLDETNKAKFRDTLLVPHFHAYQKEFVKQLDVGQKSKLNLNVCASKKKTSGMY